MLFQFFLNIKKFNFLNNSTQFQNIDILNEHQTLKLTNTKGLYYFRKLVKPLNWLSKKLPRTLYNIKPHFSLKLQSKNFKIQYLDQVPLIIQLYFFVKNWINHFEINWRLWIIALEVIPKNSLWYTWFFFLKTLWWEPKSASIII